MLAVSLAAALGPLAACSGSGAGTTPGTASATTASSPGSGSTDSECRARKPPFGDVIFLWMNSIGGPTAVTLPGGWVLNEVTGSCQTTVQYRINTTPTGPGNCVQVALVADNPGYDVHADPLPPLQGVFQEFGNCAIATPAVTTPPGHSGR